MAIIYNPDPETGSYFGYSTAISDDGERCIVGGYGENTSLRRGSAYVFIKSNCTWVLEQEIVNPAPELYDWFGFHVSIDTTGTRVIVSSHGTAGSVNQGVAYIYSRSDTTWTLEQTITNPTPETNDFFGVISSLDSAGERCIISGHADNTGASSAGSVYIYLRSGTTWSLEETINNPTPANTDYFGRAVSMDSTGTRIIVGAFQDNTYATHAGSVYIYVRSGITWTLEDTINNPTPSLDDYFGWSVSIDSTGTRILVGAYGDNTTANDTGTIYVYLRSGITWTLEDTIENPFPNTSDWFGYSVSINSSGTKLISGALKDDTTAPDAGSAYIFTRSDTNWTLEQTINNPTTAVHFGISVDICADGMYIIGSPNALDISETIAAGTAYIYDCSVGQTPIYRFKLLRIIS